MSLSYMICSAYKSPVPLVGKRFGNEWMEGLVLRIIPFNIHPNPHGLIFLKVYGYSRISEGVLKEKLFFPSGIFLFRTSLKITLVREFS